MEKLLIKRRVRKLSFLVWIGQGVLKFLTFLSCGLFVYLVLDYFLFLPSAIRLLFLILVCLTGLGASLIFKFNPAQEIEHHFPEFKGRLFASISEYPAETGYSQELIEKIRSQTSELLKSINLSQVVKKKLLWLLKPLLISVISLVVLTLFIPCSGIWVKRFFLPTSKFLSLSIYPGDTKLTYGDSLNIEIVPHGLLPRKVFLHIRAIHELPELCKPKGLPYRRTGFKTTLPEVTQEIIYYAELGDVSSDTHKILVQVKPWVKSLKIKYAYPEYTNIPSFVSEVPTIEGLYGTQVTLLGESNVHLDSAEIEFKSSKVQKCKSAQTDKEKFKVEFKITENDSYQIWLTGENGLSNENPEVWSIGVWNDELPQVEVLFPAVDIELPVSMRVPIIAHMMDDYGILNTYLVSDSQKWQIVGASGSTGILPAICGSTGILPVVADVRQLASTDTVISYEWDISALSLLPGDVVKYWLEVYDNDMQSGPKLGKSQVYRVYFPRIEDIYEELTEQEEKSISQFEKVDKELEARSKELENLANKDEFGWKEKQEIAQMLKREKEIEREIKELTSSLNELQKTLERTWWVDRDLAEKIKELQNLFSELNLSELQEAIRKVEEALHKNPELLAEALKNLNLTQEELRKRVERTIELLKQFRNEQQLKALAEKSKELEEWQARINEQTEKGDSLRALSDEEKALEEELEGLAKDLEELRKEMPSLYEPLTEETNRANQIGSKLKEASSKLSRGKKPSKLQQEILSELNTLSENLFSLSDQLAQQGKEQIAQEIRKLEQEFLFLSFEEEAMKGEGLDRAFRQEAIIKGTKTELKELSALMNITPFISNATKSHISKSLSSMEKAKHPFEKGLLWKGEEAQKEAMAELNKAVLELIKSERALECACSGTGLPQLMEQLSQLTQKQEGLNKLLQSLLPLNLAPSELMEQLMQIAGKQQALAEELQQIAQGLKGKVLGDLGSTAEEMEKIARDLQEGISEEIVERQKRVLKHLLDSQKSIYTKKQSRKRISESGKGFVNLKSPPSPEFRTKRGVSQKDIIRALREKYPEEYECLIRAYFRALATE